MSTAKPLHVLIAGGGLSGLALAQGLIKDGHTCEVFERDADDTRKIGYYLHMNADGGEALRRCLPADLFELYAQTSRRTYDRRESVVLDDQLNELSSQPHLGPPNEGERPHTGVHRRTLRAILRARLGDSFHPGQPVTGYEETPDNVTVTLADGSTAEGDVLVGADGIRSAVRGQKLPGTTVIDTGVRGLGVFGRTPLTPELAAQLPPHLFEGVIIAADRKGSRLLIAVYRPRQRAAGRGGRDRARRDARAGRGLRHDQLQRGARDGDPARGAVDGRHAGHAPRRHAGRDRGLASRRAGPGRGRRPRLDLRDPVRLPRARPAVGAVPGHAGRRRRPRHAPHPRPGRQPRPARRRAPARPALRGGPRRVALVPAIGAYEQGMRDYVYPFMRMTMEHDRQFGGGALEDR